MKREEILEVFRSLSQSQGFYGRLLDDLYSVSEDVKETFLSHLEAQNFKDPLDLILYIEG